MKLSWRDIITTLLLVAGGAVVYAKYYQYSWAVIESWRSAVAVIAAIGAGIFAFSGFSFANHSWLNIGEMILGAAIAGVAITGMLVTSEPLFYVLAGMIAAWWLVDTARHARHSLMHDSGTRHHHAPAH